jgi:hypothetical protein
MKIVANRKFWLATIVVSIVVLGIIVQAGVVRRRSALSPSAKTLAQLPPVMLWAWERPEELSFLDTNRVGVAFLAATITLHDNDVAVRPRLQPLNVPAGTKLVAVVRIETDRRKVPTLTSEQLDKTVSTLISTARAEGILALQIDFDATLSQRNFYRALLKQLRHSLPTDFPLSITALASWCAGDNWLEDLPIDEAVPMLFRLGVEKRQFQSGFQLSATPCKASAGISTDEPLTVPQVERLYIFNPRPWSQSTIEKTLEAYNQ